MTSELPWWQGSKMARRVHVPKNKKEIARPSREWIEFGMGLGHMRDASFARSDEDIKVAANLLADLVKDRANIVKDSRHVYQSYWYMLQECKKILAEFEEKTLNDLVNLGVSVRNNPPKKTARKKR
jgi:hypothetical protein